ncbi:SIR2 family protein [Paraburkholderia strydomiana]
MSVYFEIAYAAASESLTLFTGTGFSKSLTEGRAPSWQQLLEYICNSHEASAPLVQALFPVAGQHSLTLEEAAQAIQIQLKNAGRDMHVEVAEAIKLLELSGDNTATAAFFKANPLNVITTNYDKLVEKLVENQNCLSFAPGLPIPRSVAHTNVYHVHGSVDSPKDMVVTADDYFRFINAESFFSRKLSTVLHEETVVILGYSLGDTNLKAILSDYRGYSRKHLIGGNIFFVSRAPVSQLIKDYYSHCYGIRVLDQLEINVFFSAVNFYMNDARKTAATAVLNINEVLFNNKFWTDEYLRGPYSFYEIVAGVAAIGRSINDPLVVDMIRRVIDKKNLFTAVHNAWPQYEHLAQWLIYIGSILEIRGTILQDIYLIAVMRSMSTMSAKQELGYSWHAYTYWDQGWSNVISANRTLIRQYADGKLFKNDARALIARG